MTRIGERILARGWPGQPPRSGFQVWWRGLRGACCALPRSPRTSLPSGSIHSHDRGRGVLGPPGLR